MERRGCLTTAVPAGVVGDGGSLATRILATVYALWALAFVLLYAGGPFYVLGFDNPFIGTWAVVMFAHAVAFAALAAAAGKGGRLLVAAAISFAVINLWPAYLYYQWLPRGLVVRHLPPDLLPVLHLAPALFLALIVLGLAAARAASGARG